MPAEGNQMGQMSTLLLSSPWRQVIRQHPSRSLSGEVLPGFTPLPAHTRRARSYNPLLEARWVPDRSPESQKSLFRHQMLRSGPGLDSFGPVSNHVGNLIRRLWGERHTSRTSGLQTKHFNNSKIMNWKVNKWHGSTPGKTSWSLGYRVKQGHIQVRI